MNPRLVVLRGRQSNREIALPFGEFRIGRSDTCHLRPGSEHVSREHCVLAVERGRVLLYDMGSFNGTWVNGERIEGEAVLHDGDQIQIGPLVFEFWCDPPPQASTSSWLCRRQVSADAISQACGENDVVPWPGGDGSGQPPNSSKETLEMPSTGDATASSAAPPKPRSNPITRTPAATGPAAAAILARMRSARHLVV